MKKRKSMLAIAALTLCMSVCALPTTVHATEVEEGFEDLIDEEEEEGEQTTVEAPDADTDSSTGDGGSSGGSSSNGNSGTTSSTSSAAKSSDSSLSRLSISPGTLSPSFSAGTYSYTATVDANVKSISVGAKPNHAKAVIASVSGAKSLTPGTNTVKVVVEAENGATSTYTITVNCGEATAADQPTASEETSVEGTIEGTIEEEQPAEETETEKPASEVSFDSNGYLIYHGEAYVPAEMMPEGEYVSLDKYNKLYEQSQSANTRNTRIMIALIVALVLLLIVVFNLILKLRDAHVDAKLGMKDDDDDMPIKKTEKKRNVKKEKEVSVAPAVDTGMIPDVQMPEHMKEEVHKKPKARPKKNAVQSSEDDGLEILDLNDL